MSTLEKVNSKLGQIIKCPNCGAQVNRLQVKCPECGFLFSDVEANATSASLLDKLEQIDMDCMNNPKMAVSRKLQVIQNFPIPNTREDLLEMMTLCHANVAKTSDKELANAWAVKTTQLVSKAEILLKGDKDAEAMISKIKATEANSKRKKIILFSVVGVVAAVVIAILALGWSSHSQLEAEHNQVIAEWQHRISDAVQEAEYAYAYDYLDSLNLYIESQRVSRNIYKELTGSSYLKLVMALLREDAIEDAAVVALDYRDKLNDQKLWHESQIYKLMKQTCEAQNIDDSVLE
jgi:hypothetical protein